MSSFKHDFSHLSDYDLEVQHRQVSNDLDGAKTYWYTEEVGRDHNRFMALKEELEKRNER